MFITWLKFMPSRRNNPVVFGPGSTPIRCESRINQILVATRGFLAFAVLAGAAAQSVMEQIYEIGDTTELSATAQGEDLRLRYRLRARHRLHEPAPGADRATDEEIITLLRVCRSARDRLIVLLLTRAGLRRGEVAGIRRADLHLLPDNRRHDCLIEGAHLNVVRRPNANGHLHHLVRLSRREQQHRCGMGTGIAEGDEFVHGEGLTGHSVSGSTALVAGGTRHRGFRHRPATHGQAGAPREGLAASPGAGHLSQPYRRSRSAVCRDFAPAVFDGRIAGVRPPPPAPPLFGPRGP
ncbi:hypothetical protein [Nocardia salmonicida]